MDTQSNIQYQKDFRIAFLEKRGDAFQGFFEELMGKVYPGDFCAVAPWGRQGDQKCDGFLRSKRILFQVYAPHRLSASKAIEKVEKDFQGARKHWKEHFDKWVFVYNTDNSRLPPEVVQYLSDLGAGNPDIGIGHWGYQELLIEFRKLDLPALASWFGPPIDAQTYANLGYEDLQAVLYHLQVASIDEIEDVREVTQGKIEANQLSPACASYLKLGMQKYRLVEKFFRDWRDPHYESRLAKAFKNRYIVLKDEEPALHPDLIWDGLSKWAGGQARRPPNEEVAILAILAYFFEKCVVFEDAGSSK